MEKRGSMPFEKWLVGNIVIIGILVLVANLNPDFLGKIIGKGTPRYEMTVISISLIVHTLFFVLPSRMKKK